MTFPSTIRPAVGQSLISKVSRLYNGTIADVLHELFQNSRRAGAMAIYVAVYNLPEGTALSIYDDGSGIDDPATLLTLGDSGWQADILDREDPAGMGVFSLAGQDVQVRSWSQSAGRGWAVHIPADGWEGGLPLAIEPSGIVRGTEFQIRLPDAWETQLDAALRKAALFFPLPVHFAGAELARADFLGEADRVEEWEGCRIGIYPDGTSDDPQMPRINFHGLTVPCRLPVVDEVDHLRKWRVRIDIVDAPALQLVLPARKEMVENDALSRLRLAAETAIYRAIAAKTSHRLAHKAWLRAGELGMSLPEAASWLNGWEAATADNFGRTVGAPVHDGPMILMPDQEPDIEQPLARALQKDQPLGARAVREERAFAGYAWYDALPRVLASAFRFEREGAVHRYGSEIALPAELDSGAVDRLCVEIAIAPNADPSSIPEILSLPIDMLACNNETWSLDDAVILFDVQADVQPGALAGLIYASLFCASDDHDCDSWETQSSDFEARARDLANRLLLGEDDALIARVREAIFEHVQWLIPEGRSLSLTASLRDLTLTFDRAA